MKSAIQPRDSQAGISLIEMLMAVALLGIVSSLALAWFGGDSSQLDQARDQRNAQSICSMCHAAEAAGMNVAAEANTVLDVAERLVAGVTIDRGIFRGRTFQIPGLGTEELQGATRFLSLRGGQLHYEVNRRAKKGEMSPGDDI